MFCPEALKLPSEGLTLVASIKWPRCINDELC
jgi:hypothetical protein